jgi:hypothetical protein
MGRIRRKKNGTSSSDTIRSLRLTFEKRINNQSNSFFVFINLKSRLFNILILKYFLYTTS